MTHITYDVMYHDGISYEQDTRGIQIIASNSTKKFRWFSSRPSKNPNFLKHQSRKKTHKERKKKPQVKLKGTRGAKLLALDSKGLRLNIVKQFTYLIDMSWEMSSLERRFFGS